MLFRGRCHSPYVWVPTGVFPWASPHLPLVYHGRAGRGWREQVPQGTEAGSLSEGGHGTQPLGLGAQQKGLPAGRTKYSHIICFGSIHLEQNLCLLLNVMGTQKDTAGKQERAVRHPTTNRHGHAHAYVKRCTLLLNALGINTYKRVHNAIRKLSMDIKKNS